MTSASWWYIAGVFSGISIGVMISMLIDAIVRPNR